MGILSWRRKRRIGLALSGGGARGFAHLGVVQALLDEGIVPHAISGTSAGSLVGALMAAGVSFEAIEKKVLDVGWTKLARPVIPPQRGLFTLAPVEKLLEELLGDKRQFKDLPIPFACVATDVDYDEAVVLKEGHLASAVRASCSIPGVFVPVEREGRLLVDGGVMVNLPVQCLLDMGCDYVIAVDVLPGRVTPARPKGIFELMMVTFYNLVRSASREAELANVVIVPDIRSYSFADFERRYELIDLGKRAAHAALDQIRFDLGLSRHPGLRTRLVGMLLDVRTWLSRHLLPSKSALRELPGRMGRSLWMISSPSIKAPTAALPPKAVDEPRAKKRSRAKASERQ